MIESCFTLELKMENAELIKQKVILLFILIISSIFILGCKTHGEEDDTNVITEFCSGKYFYSSSVSHNMIYGACNQSQASGYFYISGSGERILGSSFKPPVNCSDSDGWIADGFAEQEKSYKDGNYTMCISVKGQEYYTSKDLTWDRIPNWKDTPSFDTTQANSTSRTITVVNPGLNLTEEHTGYTVRYRLKVYVGGETISNQLYGQTCSYDKSCAIAYCIPKITRSTQLIPVLVAELYVNNRIERVLFYPGKQFTFNVTNF